MNKENAIFFVLKSKLFPGPFISSFLFGEQKIGEESYIYSDAEIGDVVEYSKNIAIFPKLLIGFELVIPGSLKIQLEKSIDVKWRKVIFSQPFHYDWRGSDGFDILEEQQKELAEDLKRQGFEPGDEEYTGFGDDDLMYEKISEKYRVDNYRQEMDFWEVICKNSTYSVNHENFHDVVPFDSDSLEFGKQNNDHFFSLSSLAKYGLLRLVSGTYAMTADVFKKFEPFVEEEYYDVLPFDRSNFPFSS